MHTTDSLALAYGTAVEDMGGGLTAAVLRPYADVEIMLSVEGDEITVTVCPVEQHAHGDHADDYVEQIHTSQPMGDITDAWSSAIMDMRDAGIITAGA